MEEGLGPGVVAVGVLSQEEGELGLQSFVVGGPAVFFLLISGACRKLVPAYTSSSIFCEKLRSGDAGERDSVSGERGSSSGVSVTVMCCPGFPGCFPESCPWGVESWSFCNTSQSACDEICGQGSAGMSMSNACLAARRYQCPCGFFNHMMTRKLI